MYDNDEWAITVERLRPAGPESGPRGAAPSRRRRRGRISLPAGVRRLLPLAIVVGGLWAAGVELPATAIPDPLTLARQSRDLGWTAAAANTDLALDVFERVNDERTARGLDPLVWHPGLAALAGTWSQTMIESAYEHSPDGYLAHRGFAAFGENIAMGQYDTTELHVGWMESDGHRANILRPGFDAMGVGIVCRGDGRMWATQVFGMAAGSRADLAAATPPVEPVVRRDEGLSCPRQSTFAARR